LKALVCGNFTKEISCLCYNLVILRLRNGSADVETNAERVSSRHCYKCGLEINWC